MKNFILNLPSMWDIAFNAPHRGDRVFRRIVLGFLFVWRGRRPFGPHISTEALWEVARRVDVRSAKHVDDRPKEDPS